MITVRGGVSIFGSAGSVNSTALIARSGGPVPPLGGTVVPSCAHNVTITRSASRPSESGPGAGARLRPPAPGLCRRRVVGLAPQVRAVLDGFPTGWPPHRASPSLERSTLRKDQRPPPGGRPERFAPRNWSLRTKLAIVLAVPAVLAVVLGGLRIVDQVSQAGELGRVARFVDAQGD